ncbi:MAG: hypothetical protein ED559_06095 [Phycisphaera sp.]|nr:MAG: hypothetical protein ED559_06095 [Phycisphaera sp.]
MRLTTLGNLVLLLVALWVASHIIDLGDAHDLLAGHGLTWIELMVAVALGLLWFRVFAARKSERQDR